MKWALWIAIGAVFSALGVGLGAFGAHALKSTLTERMLEVFEVGVRYQMYHAFGLIVIGLVASRLDSPLIHAAAIALMVGIFLFSGSLYAMAFTGIRQLGMITPVGGVAFMIGWCLLAFSLIKVQI
jgi:uncharacterized membrane protein YgdD (TMEM256/DUF423 family)